MSELVFKSPLSMEEIEENFKNVDIFSSLMNSLQEAHVYAGNATLPLKVSSVSPLDNHMLLLHFNTGEAKVFDFKPLLNEPAFTPLQNSAIFNSVYIDHGVTVWNNGDIDIAPEYLYEKGVAVSGSTSA